ncbi:MAG: hypothetical protein SGPRY_013501 [Prymnesium sp.]
MAPPNDPFAAKTASPVKCKHGATRTRCNLCRGHTICVHNVRKTRCVPCRGGSLCPHLRRKEACVTCIKRAQEDRNCGTSALAAYSKRGAYSLGLMELLPTASIEQECKDAQDDRSYSILPKETTRSESSCVNGVDLYVQQVREYPASSTQLDAPFLYLQTVSSSERELSDDRQVLVAWPMWHDYQSHL